MTDLATYAASIAVAAGERTPSDIVETAKFAEDHRAALVAAADAYEGRRTLGEVTRIDEAAAAGLHAAGFASHEDSREAFDLDELTRCLLADVRDGVATACAAYAELLAAREGGAHFTAWVTTDPSAVEGGIADVTVVIDERVVVGSRYDYDLDDDVDITDWDSTGVAVLVAPTGIACDGDDEVILAAARELLGDAGWTLVGGATAVPTGYTITVER